VHRPDQTVKIRQLALAHAPDPKKPTMWGADPNQPTNRALNDDN